MSNKMKVAVASLVPAVSTMAFTMSAKASDFDATSTQSMFDTAIANVTPTLAHGVPIIIGIGLGIWAIFFLVRKLRKNTK